MGKIFIIRNKVVLFKLYFSLFFLVVITNDKVFGQDDFNVIKNNWLQFTDAPNSLYHHLANQAYGLLDKRASDVSRLGSLSEWKRKQAWTKEILMGIVGPFPEKTPLNATVTRIIAKDGYRIEHIIYESQPGFFVTSSMFIPEGLSEKDKAPVVIYCSGHSGDGYRNPIYIHTILNLVKKGFIVFAFDPVGQGERLQYFDPKTGKSVVGDATMIEHSYPGSQVFIVGSSLARYMIWDGIRAIDYLLTRKEVDPARIGITGRSGGGTQSAYIAALDDRIYAVAPENYITNYYRLFQSIGPQDAEQNIFNCIQKGIDHPDLLIVRAPKPALMITTTRDFFSIQGALETEKEVKEIYGAYGKEGNFTRVEDDASHASTEKNREAMYAFFQAYLNTPGNSCDEETQPLNPEEMKVTPTGQVSTSLSCETVFSLNGMETEKLLNELYASRNDLAGHLPKVISSAKKLSGYLEPVLVNEPVFTGRIRKEGYIIEKYFIKGEGDYPIPYLLMKPDNPNNKALIYLHPSGKAAEASNGGEIEWFVRNGFTVLSPDMLGLGETGPGVYKGDAYIEGISHNLWYASMLIGRSIVGIRAGDVVRLARVLQEGLKMKQIYGFARKEMSPVLLHAAAFDPCIVRVALIEPCSSYRSIVTSRFYNPLFIYGAVPGALKAYDLPDLAACLAPRKLMMVGITDGLGNSDITGTNEDLAIINAAYRYVDAGEQLNIVTLKQNVNLHDSLSEWIK